MWNILIQIKWEATFTKGPALMALNLNLCNESTRGWGISSHIKFAWQVLHFALTSTISIFFYSKCPLFPFLYEILSKIRIYAHLQTNFANNGTNTTICSKETIANKRFHGSIKTADGSCNCLICENLHPHYEHFPTHYFCIKASSVSGLQKIKLYWSQKISKYALLAQRCSCCCRYIWHNLSCCRR